MAEVPLFIPDANAALRWLLPDRPFHEPAMAMVEDFGAGRINLTAPYHLPLEVASGIRWQVANHKMTHEEETRRFSVLLAAAIPTENPPGLLETAFQNCQRFSINIRDALYISLAEIYRVPLIATDENLLRATARFPYRLALAEYDSPQN